MKKMAMLVSGSNTDSEKDSIWPVVQFLKRHIKGFIVTQKLVWADGLRNKEKTAEKG